MANFQGFAKKPRKIRKKIIYAKTNLAKLVSAIFYQIFIFSPNGSPSKTMKNVFYLI